MKKLYECVELLYYIIITIRRIRKELEELKNGKNYKNTIGKY